MADVLVERHRLRRRDLVWLTAAPVYMALAIWRHEMVHAAAALLEGHTVHKVVFWPQHDAGHFTWGYVRHSGGGSTFVGAAPYLVDALLLAGSFLACRRWRWSHAGWINVVAVGMVSSLVNSAYNYRSLLDGVDPPFNDVEWLSLVTSVPAMHVAFLSLLVLGTLATTAVLFPGVFPRAAGIDNGARSGGEADRHLTGSVPPQ